MNSPTEKFRYPIPTLVDLEFEDGTFHHDYSANMHTDGMRIETTKLLPVGKKATLRFCVPNLDWVFEVKSHVTESVDVTMEERLDGKKSYIELLFLSMDDQDQSKLHEYFRDFKIESLEL
jgi:hypothetical protein